MRPSEIANDDIPCRSSLMPNAEVEFDAACRSIESGDWDKAYEIFDLLGRESLPPGFAEVVQIASDILDPANSPSERAEKIAQFFLGRAFRVYDDQHGWHEDALRELAEVKRSLSEPDPEPRPDAASRSSAMP